MFKLFQGLNPYVQLTHYELSLLKSINLQCKIIYKKHKLRSTCKNIKIKKNSMLNLLNFEAKLHGKHNEGFQSNVKGKPSCNSSLGSY